MRRHAPVFVTLLSIACFVLACSSDAPSTGLDSTTGQDATVGDGGGGPDGAEDAGPAPDLGVDAGDDAGTSTTTDAGFEDTGVDDAGTSTSADAGFDDAGLPIDAGTPDAGTPDSGLPPGLGDACADPSECTSGYCFARVGQDVCSLCAVNGDCGPQQACRYSQGDGYASCVGIGNLGATCTGDEQCASGFCNSGVCSQCNVTADCTGGGNCVDDTQDSGYYICTGGLGDACADATECGSGYCFNPPGGGPNRCSECEVNGDCGAQRACDYSFGDQYASCVGTGDLGDLCNDANQCASGFCQGGVCSQCSVSADCAGGGTCVDDTNGAGYYICSGGLGDVCTVGTECNSGFCYPVPALPDRCSECETAMDCPNNQNCVPSIQQGYAVCF